MTVCTVFLLLMKNKTCIQKFGYETTRSISMGNLQHRMNSLNILMFCITSTSMFCQYSCTKPLWTTISDCNYRCSLLGKEIKLKKLNLLNICSFTLHIRQTLSTFPAIQFPPELVHLVNICKCMFLSIRCTQCSILFQY